MVEDPQYLGSFEELVLLAVLVLGMQDNAYGVTIWQRVESSGGRSTSMGAIYATLDRLEQKGLVRSSQGEATPQRGGRAKRYFKIEALGERALAEAEQVRLGVRHGERVPVSQGGAR